MTQFDYDLFVSYALDDRAWVEGYLFDALTAVGLKVHTEAAFALGVPRIAEFERAIERSRRVVLVLSPAYLADRSAAFFELLAQHDVLDSGAWRVIPLIRRTVPLPSRLARLTELDATTEEAQEAAIARLYRELAVAPPASAAPLACPYPGMRTFSTEQADYFFGREDETAEIVRRLALHPARAIIGDSGSGKSSLVHAGVLPALRRSQRFGEGEWHVQTMRPGTEPLATLVAALDALPSEGKRLLIVDQFEECFTLEGEESTRFQRELVAIIERGDIRVLLTVRSDFYQELRRSPIWPLIKGHLFELEPLGREGLRAAVEGPAKKVDVYIEAALVERLIHDAANEAGVLPCLQETLVLLWEHLEHRYLGVGAYERFVKSGRAHNPGAQTALQLAMALHADNAYEELPSEQQQAARRLFLRLVLFNERGISKEPRPTRRQRSMEALLTIERDHEKSRALVRHFAARRLLTLTGEPDAVDERVDLSHESLIEGWPRFARWVEEGRSREQQRREWEGAVREWERYPTELLGPVRLAEAETWVAEAEPGEDTAELRSLIAASQAALERDATERRGVRRRIYTLLALLGITLIVFGAPLVATAINHEWLWWQAKYSSPTIAVSTADATVEIEKYEVSRVNYCRCMDADQCDPRITPACGTGDEFPVTNVAVAEAAAYCEWIGRVLPTAEQWRLAASGGTTRPYPTGADTPSLPTVNIGIQSCDYRSDLWEVHMAEGQDITDEGIVGMAGNVSEWIAPVDIAPNFKGGNICSSRDTAHVDYIGLRRRDDETNNTIGFRCALPP